MNGLLLNVSKLKTFFMEAYHLDNVIGDRLGCDYFRNIENKGNKKWVIIEDDAENMNEKSIRKQNDSTYYLVHIYQ